MPLDVRLGQQYGSPAREVGRAIETNRQDGDTHGGVAGLVVGVTGLAVEAAGLTEVGLTP